MAVDTRVVGVTLQRALEALHVVAGEVRRLVEGDGAVVTLGEDAVEDDDVEAVS